MVYPVHISDENFKNCMDLLLITDGNKSHYVYIKDCNRFMCSKTKCKSKKHFCKYCLQCSSSKKVLAEHKGISLKLKSGLIKFKNFFKQLPVPFMIYADFECDVKELRVVMEVL